MYDAKRVGVEHPEVLPPTTNPDWLNDAPDFCRRPVSKYLRALKAYQDRAQSSDINFLKTPGGEYYEGSRIFRACYEKDYEEFARLTELNKARAAGQIRMTRINEMGRAAKLMVVGLGVAAVACTRSDGLEREGGPPDVHYFEEVLPTVTVIPRSDPTRFRLRFAALEREFEIELDGQPPKNSARGSLAPDDGLNCVDVTDEAKTEITNDEDEARDPVVMIRGDGTRCVPRADGRTRNYFGRITAKPAAGSYHLWVRDGQWGGSIETADEIYVLRPRSWYDDNAPRGTSIVYRFSDTDEFDESGRHTSKYRDVSSAARKGGAE